MKLLRKIKIGTRLYIMYGFLVAIIIVIAYSSTKNRLSMIDESEFLSKNYVGHLDMLAKVNITTGNLFLSYRNYYLEYPDQEKMQVRLNDIHERTSFILSNLQDYQTALQNRNAPQAEIDAVVAAIAKINDEVVPFNTKIIDLVQSDKMDEVHALIISKELRSLRSSFQDDLITAIYDMCLKNANDILFTNIEEMKRENIITLIQIALGILISATVVTLIIRSVVRPIKRLMLVADDVSNGNIDVNLPVMENDEVGELTNQFGNVASVLKSVINEMNNMAKQHSIGNIDETIDETLFKGAYKDVAVGVNDMTSSYIKHMEDLIVCLQALGDGDFNVEYAPLPGKKQKMSDAVEMLRTNIKAIDREVTNIAEAAVEGRLDVRVNHEDFKGEWKILFMDLNSVMDAIITPINEAAEALATMAKGDMKARITGEFKGDFGIIKKSLNSTQDIISSYIMEISNVLTEISHKNLDIQINNQYIGDFVIIKDSINKIVETLNIVLAEFNSSAEQVDIGSTHISESSFNLSQGATEQASAVEELSASITLISENTNKNAETANNANLLVEDIKENAQKEAHLMQETLETMDEINQSSESISKIIKVIEDIAFQTNLLALNAAVEAARAGEHGKGFAVVAEEVRSLAGRSQKAAQDTTELIESSVKRASDGARIANETSLGLTTIVQQISEVSGYISMIAKASSEQNSSIAEISTGLGQVSAVAQNNTSISEESAASAQELSSQAESFRNAVAMFKLKS